MPGVAGLSRGGRASAPHLFRSHTACTRGTYPCEGSRGTCPCEGSRGTYPWEGSRGTYSCKGSHGACPDHASLPLPVVAIHVVGLRGCAGAADRRMCAGGPCGDPIQGTAEPAGGVVQQLPRSAAKGGHWRARSPEDIPFLSASAFARQDRCRLCARQGFAGLAGPAGLAPG